MTQIAAHQGQTILVVFRFLEEKMVLLNVKVVKVQLLGFPWKLNLQFERLVFIPLHILDQILTC